MPVIVTHLKKHHSNGSVCQVRTVYSSAEAALKQICEWNDFTGVHSPYDRVPIKFEKTDMSAGGRKYPYRLDEVEITPPRTPEVPCPSPASTSVATAEPASPSA